uniref:Uncharacterized protein n=1 Tax=viral metagenome TaxID=1070528 RepID=A0A6H1ZXK8_9ZZZZ
MKKAKRWRSPRAKPGQLKVQWGKLPDDDPDIVYSGGIGTNGCDRALLHHVFGSPRYTYDGNTTPSLYDELEARGYDLTTLKFSIEKRKEEKGD